jgi:hypothetical protein
MTYQWTEKSRYNTLRHYKVSSDEKTLTVTCDGVLYYSCTGDLKEKLEAVDPDGGPYLCIGRVIEHDCQKWTIQNIRSHEKKKSDAVFVFDIQKVGDSV